MNTMLNQMNTYAAALRQLAQLVLQLQEAIQQKEAKVVGQPSQDNVIMIDGIKEQDAKTHSKLVGKIVNILNTKFGSLGHRSHHIFTSLVL